MAGADIVRLFGEEAPVDIFDPGSEDLPRNIGAERAIIGTLLQRNSALDNIIDLLQPNMFYDRLMGIVYDEIRRRLVGGDPVDVVTLADWVSADQSFIGERHKATQYLSTLLACGLSINIRGYGESVSNCSVRRELIATAQKALTVARNPRANVRTEVSKLSAEMEGAAAGTDRHRTSSFDEALGSALQQAQTAHVRRSAGGLPIPGFPRTSHAFLMLPEEFTVLAGRHGSGKSGLAWQWAIGMARRIRDERLNIREVGGIIGFSLEMRKSALAIRAISAASGVPADRILRGETSDHEIEAAERAAKELAGLPLRLLDINGLSKDDIKLLLFREQLRWGKIGLCVIDHLNLVNQGAYGERHGPVAGTSGVADAAQGLAKQFHCHILGLCQLTTGDMAKRRDHRPLESDIRYSGNFAQNADNIGLLHRAIQWEPETPLKEDGEYEDSYRRRKSEAAIRRETLEGEAEMIIAKARMGRAGYTIPLLFHGPTTSFSEEPSSPLP